MINREKEQWTEMETEMQKLMDHIQRENPDYISSIPGIAEDMKRLQEMREQDKKAAEERELFRTRRKARRRLIAACFVAATVLGIGTGIFLNSDTAHAMKFAMEKMYYQSKGWVQATDPGQVNDENVIVITTTTEGDVQKYKEIWEGLMVPRYITDGYKFEELYLEKHLNGFTTAIYTYKNNEEMLLSIMLHDINDDSNEILWNDINYDAERSYQYRVWEDEISGLNGMDALLNGSAVTICAPIPYEELIRIMDNLQ